MSHLKAVLELYGGRVPAARGDKWLPMCCPFHGDSQASAGVNETAGKFRCHGCMSKAEDAIGLIMWWEELDYGMAVKRCESVVGGSISPVRGSTQRTGPSGLSKLFG